MGRGRRFTQGRDSQGAAFVRNFESQVPACKSNSHQFERLNAYFLGFFYSITKKWSDCSSYPALAFHAEDAPTKRFFTSASRSRSLRFHAWEWSAASRGLKVISDIYFVCVTVLYRCSPAVISRGSNFPPHLTRPILSPLPLRAISLCFPIYVVFPALLKSISTVLMSSMRSLLTMLEFPLCHPPSILSLFGLPDSSY